MAMISKPQTTAIMVTQMTRKMRLEDAGKLENCRNDPDA